VKQPLEYRKNAFHSSEGPKPKSSGQPELKYRYRLQVEDTQGNIEGVVYANRRQELSEKLDELEGRDRFAPVPLQASKKS